MPAFSKQPATSSSSSRSSPLSRAASASSVRRFFCPHAPHPHRPRMSRPDLLALSPHPPQAPCPASRRPAPLSRGVASAAGLRNGSICHSLCFLPSNLEPLHRAPSAIGTCLRPRRSFAALPLLPRSQPADGRNQGSHSRGSKSTATAGKHLKELCSLILSRRWIHRSGWRRQIFSCILLFACTDWKLDTLLGQPFNINHLS
ncbi:hypothetical protein EJB05_19768, partial [Eragrostis curvula]